MKRGTPVIWCALVLPARLPAITAAAILLLYVAVTQADENPRSLSDPRGDTLIRRTDPNGLLPCDVLNHRAPDLRDLKLGRWSPSDPQTDLFTGAYDTAGLFLRLDITFDGLINPPGDNRPWNFTPFTYGPNPVFGFIEIDMDRNAATGGEVDGPQYRYLGNAARFGGVPNLGYLYDRFAMDAAAFDGDFDTKPYVERSGEEFHLALLGDLFLPEDVVEVAGNADQTFDAGEIWLITARWFHRAHGYEPFSFVYGGARAGAYEPLCTLRFAHDPNSASTELTLVTPLTNAGAALMLGEPVQPSNFDSSDQCSVLEALLDLEDSAAYLHENPTGLPEQKLINGWYEEEPATFLDPTNWRVTALVGTTYLASAEACEYFVWTDIYPGVVRGDVNGNGIAGNWDRGDIARYIRDHDADDGQIDNLVVLSGFPGNFSGYDVNQDGVVDALDELLVSRPGDLDLDGDVDLIDIAQFQTCEAGSARLCIECGLGDLDMDGDVDGADFLRLADLLAGP
jgi:hypothetical protein